MSEGSWGADISVSDTLRVMEHKSKRLKINHLTFVQSQIQWVFHFFEISLVLWLALIMKLLSSLGGAGREGAQIVANKC